MCWTRFLRFAAPELLLDRGGSVPGQVDAPLLSGFHVVEDWEAWGKVGGRGEVENRQGVTGKMTLTPGIWRQVAEEGEEESWTATPERTYCG